MRLCTGCGSPGRKHQTTERTPAGWVSRYVCLTCGYRSKHDHSPEVSRAMDEELHTRNTTGPYAPVGMD